MSTTQKTYLAVLLAIALDCALVLLAPLSAQRGPAWLAPLIYESYSGWCHQIPERSFFLDHHPLALCHRCTGIHFGLLAGLLTYPLGGSLGRTHLPGRAPILCAAVLIGVDIVLNGLGWYRNTMLSRVMTGTFFGGVLAFYLMPGLVDMVRFISSHRHHSLRLDVGEPPVS